jgi:hypothetical protein
MSHICGVSKKFGEWYQKTNKTEDTNKLTLLAFKLSLSFTTHGLATFMKLLETVSKGLESIAEPLSHVVGLPPHGGKQTTCCVSVEDRDFSIKWYGGLFCMDLCVLAFQSLA